MRFPLILQRDASDCGPAVLAMAAAYYGKRLSIAQLREHAGTDARGTTLAGLMTAAQRVGFSARGVRATPEALKQIAVPAIAHWQENNRNHFVVIYGVSKSHVRIADPARGRRKLPMKEFLSGWTGVLLLLTQTSRLREVTGSRSRASPHHFLSRRSLTTFLSSGNSPPSIGLGWECFSSWLGGRRFWH
jgi:ATP-binding cassette subfamily B protein